MISVLYVDDEKDLLNIGKIFLERIGDFSLDIAESAAEGLLKLESKQYDAIISDYSMPEKDGIDFLKDVRSKFGDLPFILFTGRGREEVAILALNNGADFYLQKGGDPVSQFIELKNKLEKAVKEHQVKIALKNSERRLADIIDFLPDATFAIDREGKVILWNKAIEEVSGVSAVDMVGKGNYEYAIPFYGERRPILIDLIFAPQHEIKQRYLNIVQTGTMLAAETTLPRLKGISTTLWGKASPLYDPEGNVIGAIESIRDISQKERSERRLRESVERYRTLAESSHDIIYIIDRDDRIVYLNTIAAVHLGHPKDEIIGRYRSLFFPEETSKRQWISILKVFETGEALHIESIVPFPDNNTWQDTHLIPLKNQDGEVIEVMGVTRDLTERHEAENKIKKSHEELELRVEERNTELELLYKELEERIKARTSELQVTEEAYREANAKLNLLNTITRHDIMNQLTGLKGYLEIMRESLDDPEKMNELIEKESKIAETITTQIEFTRYYQDVGVTDPVWHNIKKTVDAAVQSLSVEGISIILERYDLEIFADPLFERVIYNLIDNSLRYGGEKLSRIEISWYVTEYGMCLVHEDDGMGVTPADKKHIFERGFGKNTGFGLFLAKEILGITGIIIQETGTFGKGARFEMRIPNGIYRVPRMSEKKS